MKGIGAQATISKIERVRKFRTAPKEQLLQKMQQFKRRCGNDL